MDVVNSREIEHLFEVLHNWPKREEALGQDIARIAQHCLAITDHLNGGCNFLKTISKGLGLFIKSSDRLDLSSTVLHGFEEIDSSLSAELKGFARLFDDIMAENDITMNPEFVVAELPANYHIIATPFLKLSKILVALDELEYAYEVDSNKASVLCFLVTLAEVIKHIHSNVDNASQNINGWLRSWPGLAKDELMKWETLAAPELLLQKNKIDVHLVEDVSFALALIATISGIGYPLSSSQLQILEPILEYHGFALGDLVDSGFFTRAKNVVANNVRHLRSVN